MNAPQSIPLRLLLLDFFFFFETSANYIFTVNFG